MVLGRTCDRCVCDVVHSICLARATVALADEEGAAGVVGFYIQTPENKLKAKQLHDLYGATVLMGKPKSLDEVPDDMLLICVVSNGPQFDAAAVCHSEGKLEEFGDPEDPRPMVWLLMNKQLVFDQVPGLQEYMERMVHPEVR